MNITVDTSAPAGVVDAIPGCQRADLGGFGTMFISADDGAMINVTVTDNTDRLYDLHPTLHAIQGVSQYVYLVIIGTGMPSQLLAIQEMGIFTVNLDSYSRLTKFVEFVANPKRRKEKKIPPARKVNVFTPAEQILMLIPGLGEAKVGAILHNYGTLAMAMSALSWYDSDLDMPGVITPTIIQNWRDILAIPDGQVLFTSDRED